MSIDFLKYSTKALAAGLCVMPATEDGRKSPFGKSPYDRQWKEFQSVLSTEAQLREWYFTHRLSNIGYVTGAVSGNLEVIDFDDMPTYVAFKEAACAANLGHVMEQIENGYLEYSPRGVHWFYRCPHIGPNTKLASRREGSRIQVLIETRGEGGFIVAAPSSGAVNPNGEYRLISGSVETIVTIAPNDREELFRLAASFDEVPPQVQEVLCRVNNIDADRPGSDFALKTSWDEILVPHGWQKRFERGGQGFFTRPGKSHGISATTNYQDSDLLYVFSTSTEFQAGRGYGKFGVYAVLNHGGDFSAAARELARRGYGEAKRPPAASKAAPVGNVTEAPDLFTDMRLAHFLASLNRENLRYWSEARKWLLYEGGRWSTDASGGPYPLIKSMIGTLYEKGRLIADDAKRIEYLTNLLKIEGYKKQTNVLSAAKGVPELVVRSSELDRDPMLLNVRNGTLNLSTGVLEPHTPSDYITKILGVDYTPQSRCPEFLRFLDKVLAGSDKLISYLQRYIGYCLTGRTDEQVLLFLYGTGANGKTTLANILEALLADYAVTAASDLLMLRPTRNATNDVAAIRGARLVKVSEIDDGERLAEAQIKTLTGGDRITCRFLYGEFFQYTPQGKILLLGNYKPRIKGCDYGIWRRIHLVPFRVTIPKHERDPRLLDKLLAELPGILTWAVQGCQEWLRTGLMPPDEVAYEVEEYRRSEDVFQQWIEECCQVGAGHHASAKDLLQSFVEYSNWRELSIQKFGRMMAERGFVRGKSNTVYWCGIGL